MADKLRGPVAAEPMAIIGASGRYPKAENLDKLWENLTNGVDAVSETKGDRWDLGHHTNDTEQLSRIYTKCGGFIDRVQEFDAEFFGMSPREAAQVDPQHRLLLELAWEAFESSGIRPSELAGSKTGVFVGISNNDYSSLSAQTVNAYTNIGSALSIAANRISYIFDLHGPSFSVDTACSSSMVAMHQACLALQGRECNMAVVGGVNMLLSIRPWLGFARASMLSPDGRCKSFDADGKGYVRAEGAGIVLVKRLADAERDGDEILGVIVGTGVNSDGRTMGMALPSRQAQEDLLRTVYGKAGINADDVFYVEAHGTGTAVGDPIECEAIGRVLGSPRAEGRCLIGSIKSNIGHLESGAGMAGLIKLLLALKHRVIPANLHFKTPNPKIDFTGWKLKVVDEAIPLPERDDPLLFGINSFGFGGTNGHLILREYKPRQVAEAGHVENSPAAEDWGNVLLVSGRTPAALEALASSYADLLESTPEADFAHVLASAAHCRDLHSHRLALTGGSAAEVAQGLRDYVSGKTVPRLQKARSTEKSRKLALVYSGNGPQWWGMGRDLLAESPLFRAEIEKIDQIFSKLAGWSLLDEMAKPEADCRIWLTEIAQPLLFAQQVALTELLRAAGIVPDAVFGHSVGEAAAAYASGALSLEQAVTVIYNRSQMQARTAGRGRMAAVGIGAEQALKEMAAVGGWLEIAAYNSPRAVTIAGDLKALEALQARLTEQGQFIRILPLDYAFHTSAMDDIQAPLVERLAGLAPNASAVPFISTVDGTTLDGTALGVEYWWRNIREPVQFERAVASAINDHGVSVFLEVGPHPVLKDYLVQTGKSIEKAQVTALNTLRRPSEGRPSPEKQTFAAAIAAVYANGGGRIERLYTRPQRPAKLPLYAWQRSKFWRGSVELPDTITPVSREHPLLGWRTPGAEGLWTNTMQVSLLLYLKDHVVQDAVLFPAAGYVELALAAARSALTDGPVDLDTIEILRPCVLVPGSDPIVQLSLDADDGTFRIRSRASLEADEWTLHARGRMSKADTAALDQALDLEALRAIMPVEVSSAQHYAECTRRGLSYGPEFQGLQSVRLTASGATERAALAHIKVASLTEAALEGYRSHPSIFDSCIQAIIALVAQNDRTACATIPVAMGKLRVLGTLPSEVMCYAKMKRESRRSGLVDILITDLEGRVLVQLQDARLQKVEFRPSELPLLAEDWRPDPAFKALAGRAAALPLPEEVAPALARAAHALHSQPARKAYAAEIAPRIDALASAYALEALVELGAGDGPFTVATLARKAEVATDQIPLLSKLIEIAQASGQAAKTGNTWKLKVSDDAPSSSGLWRGLMLDFPAYAAELMALSRAHASLVARLKGEEADASVAMLPVIEDTAPFRTDVNHLAAEAVREIVAKWPTGKSIRVLEVNGSTGGLAAAVLPLLPPQKSDYLFTDLSDKAVSRAKTRFGDYHFFRASPGGEALSERGFDLVLSEITADTADDFVAQAHYATSKIVSNGLAVLLVRHASRFTELVFPAGSMGVSLTQDALSEHLTEAGLDGQVIVADAEAGPARYTLVVARRSDDAVTGEAPQAEHPSARRTLVVTELDAGTALVASLKEALEARGQKVSVRVVGAHDLTEEAFQRLVADEAHSTEFVHLAGFAATVAETADVMPLQDLRCMTAVLLGRAIEAHAITAAEPFSASLTLVTRRAFTGPGASRLTDPMQAPLAGIGRVMANEQGSIGCRLIDVHADASDASSGVLLAEALLARDGETEVLLSEGRRFVNRVRETSLAEQSRIAASETAKGAAPAYKLDFRPQGGIDSLYLSEIDRRAPKAGEIEIAIRAAGLNFRDVLWAMGMLPEEAVEQGFSGPTIGMECAGEVVRVGEGVTSVKPGDRVISFASSCFASHVTTLASSATMMPEGFSFAEAATIPTTFVTAWYALDYLARMEPGETVLIHGAAGGVGLAAIQIAKARGAIVIGTAGSADKQRLVRDMGADYVLSSRSLKFADDIFAITGGKGIDIVLNSLAGEAITKGLEALKPFGRFLEIGKRDLYANSRIGLRPFRQNLSYFGIDADTLLVERPQLAMRVFGEVVAALKDRTLRPLPHATTPISRASEAFRAMQQSRHVGKLVITMDDTDAKALPVVAAEGRGIKAGATYLVTGGLGGFGLATAEWLALQGATSLALVSRRGAASEEAQAALASFEAKGVTVRAFAADVADPQAVRDMLAEIRSSMAPLRGIIHSAAVIEDAPLMKVDQGLLHRVFGAKVLGAYNLHTETLGDDLDLFVMYSSSSAVVGNPGQGTYVAANIYLDALAEQRRAAGLPALSIGWGAIKDAGFLTRNAAVEEMLAHRAGMEATPVADALAEMGRLIACGATRVAAARFNLMRLGQSLAGARTPRFKKLIPEGLSATPEGANSIASALEASSVDERRALLLSRVRMHIGRVIGLDAEQVEADKPLSELGIDSLMAVELAEALEQDIGKPLSVMQMIQAGTVTGVMEAALRSFGGGAAAEKPAATGAPELNKAA